jgi:hypothetical protein
MGPERIDDGVGSGAAARAASAAATTAGTGFDPHRLDGSGWPGAGANTPGVATVGSARAVVEHTPVESTSTPRQRVREVSRALRTPVPRLLDQRLTRPPVGRGADIARTLTRHRPGGHGWCKARGRSATIDHNRQGTVRLRRQYGAGRHPRHRRRGVRRINQRPWYPCSRSRCSPWCRSCPSQCNSG